MPQFGSKILPPSIGSNPRTWHTDDATAFHFNLGLCVHARCLNFRHRSQLALLSTQTNFGLWPMVPSSPHSGMAILAMPSFQPPPAPALLPTTKVVRILRRSSGARLWPLGIAAGCGLPAFVPARRPRPPAPWSTEGSAVR